MNHYVPSWNYPAMRCDFMDIYMPAETTRVIVRNNIRGERIRLRFQNLYGRKPLILDRVMLHTTHLPWKLTNASGMEVTVKHRGVIVIRPGEILLSDPIPMEVDETTYLSVSMYASESYMADSPVLMAGNEITHVFHSAQEADLCDVAEFETRATDKVLMSGEPDQMINALCGIDVESEDVVKRILAFGDSITNIAHWSEHLASKLYDEMPGMVTVLNSGISGNRILHAGSLMTPRGVFFGKAGLHRIGNVLSDLQPDLVFFYEGINDLLHPGHTAPKEEAVSVEELYAGMEEAVRLIRLSGAQAVITTLTPADGFTGWNDAKEKLRNRYNEMIRACDSADLVLDFDSVIANPESPNHMTVSYDSGDHLHPSREGGFAMAESIDIGEIAHLLDMSCAYSTK